jgi:hypothetical protein
MWLSIDCRSFLPFVAILAGGVLMDTSCGSIMPAGSDHLCQVQLAGSMVKFDVRLKRAYHDLWLTMSTGEVDEIGDTSIKATVINEGETPLSIWRIDPEDQRKGYPCMLVPDDSALVYSGPLRLFGISFPDETTVSGSRLAIQILFSKPILKRYTAELQATWGAP